MEITLFIDTNILYVNKFNDFRKPKFVENLKRLIKDISVNNFSNRINIVIPRIVIDELIQQQIESYDAKITELRKFKFPEFDIIESDDYAFFINQQLKKDLEFIDNPHTKTLIQEYPPNFEFDNIINRAVRKLPPFEGKQKESDKGFKDVILWEMLIDYQKNNSKSRTILCSCDKIFKSEILLDESTRRVKSVFDVVNWNSGNSDLINKLGELFNTTTKLSLESKIIKDFKDVLYNGNFSNLHKRLKFENPVNQSEYLFKGLEIFDMNVISDISPHEYNGIKDYYYFMVEIKLRLDFTDDVFLDSDFGEIISTTDFYEYEVLYNTQSNDFLLISYDSVDKESYKEEDFKLEKKSS